MSPLPPAAVNFSSSLQPPVMETDQLQRQVLQHTLQEVSTRQDQGAVDCCVICLEGVSEACEAVPCQHRNFDYLCLVSWLERSQQCPLCKATIRKVLYDLDGPNAKIYVVPRPPVPQALQRPGQPLLRPHSTTLPVNARRQCRRPYRNQPRTRPTEPPASDLVRRREIYRRNQFSKHVGSNRLSRYQELTPEMFCTDGELVSRARMWIRRELQVFSFLTLGEADAAVSGPGPTNARNATERRRANNAEFLLEYVIAILKSVDIMGSRGQAEDMLADFLGRENTKLFLHELRAWLRSPFTKLEDWDRAVQYEAVHEMNGRPNWNGEPSRPSRERQGENRSASGWRQEGPSTRGDFYRPSEAGPARRQRLSSRYEPYPGQGSGRDRQ